MVAAGVAGAAALPLEVLDGFRARYPSPVCWAEG